MLPHTASVETLAVTVTPGKLTVVCRSVNAALVWSETSLGLGHYERPLSCVIITASGE